MAGNPFHPMGIGQHGDSDTLIDGHGYSHLGKKVSFQSLPDEVKKCIIQSYEIIWDI